MARFLTRCYTAVTWLEALRLAALDQTPIASIRQAPSAELVHRTEWWAWWSDERLTTAIGLPESLCPEALSPDAVSLISEVWESESPAPQCGWRTLASIQRIVQAENISTNQSVRTLSSLGQVTKLTVIFPNQEVGCLYRYVQFGEESYLCNFLWDLPFGGV
ncbi:MAG: hypothetical protein F6K00_29570 [Leptolyngbya sp. SIOISBB]|nr:hypothetical protein [Leptolyngbya sp. SIOISBB]